MAFAGDAPAPAAPAVGVVSPQQIASINEGKVRLLGLTLACSHMKLGTAARCFSGPTCGPRQARLLADERRRAKIRRFETAAITNSAAAEHSPVSNGLQPKAEQAAFRTAWHPPLARQFHTSRYILTPPHCRILLCESDTATSTLICALQLVASDSGPTITGVTTATLQQYLYELCHAVGKVGTAIQMSLRSVPPLLAPSNTLIQQHPSAIFSVP